MRRILVNIIVGFLMLQMLSLFIAPTSGEKIDIVEEKEFNDFKCSKYFTTENNF